MNNTRSAFSVQWRIASCAVALSALMAGCSGGGAGPQAPSAASGPRAFLQLEELSAENSATRAEQGAGRFTGTISSSTANVKKTPIDAPNFFSTINGGINSQLFLQLSGREDSVGNRTVTLSASFPPPTGSSTPGTFILGHSYPLGQADTKGRLVQLLLNQNTSRSASRLWRAKSGYLKVISYSNGKFKARVKDALLKSDNEAGTDKTASGHFILNGDVVFQGTEPQPQPTPTPPGTVTEAAEVTVTNVDSNIGLTHDTLVHFVSNCSDNSFGANFNTANNFHSLDVSNTFFGGDNPLKTGATLDLGKPFGTTALVQYSVSEGGSNLRNYLSTAGTLVVTKFTSKTEPITFELRDVVMKPNTFGAGTATGSFKLNAIANFKPKF